MKISVKAQHVSGRQISASYFLGGTDPPSKVSLKRKRKYFIKKDLFFVMNTRYYYKFMILCSKSIKILGILFGFLFSFLKILTYW